MVCWCLAVQINLLIPSITWLLESSSFSLGFLLRKITVRGGGQWVESFIDVFHTWCLFKGHGESYLHRRIYCTKPFVALGRSRRCPLCRHYFGWKLTSQWLFKPSSSSVDCLHFCAKLNWCSNLNSFYSFSTVSCFGSSSLYADLSVFISDFTFLVLLLGDYSHGHAGWGGKIPSIGVEAADLQWTEVTLQSVLQSYVSFLSFLLLLWALPGPVVDLKSHHLTARTWRAEKKNMNHM